MDADHTALQSLRRWNQLLLLIVLLVVVGFGGTYLSQTMKAEVGRLKIDWRGGSLHIRSAKDGPFIVTHLFKPWSNHVESSVAQLPEPIMIIDSRGHYVSEEEISALTWIGASGKTNAAPSVGTPLRAFYIVPEQAFPVEAE